MKDETEYKIEGKAWKLHALAVVFDDIIDCIEHSDLILGCKNCSNHQWVCCNLFSDSISFLSGK